MAAMQKEIDALKAQKETDETQAAPVAEEYVYAFNATIEGAESVAISEKVSNGTINVEVKAVVPAGQMVDYWLINGVQYHYGTGVTSFVVEQLDEATTYEVVLKEKPITYYTKQVKSCFTQSRLCTFAEAAFVKENGSKMPSANAEGITAPL